jgi:hypothetical protein
MWHAMTGYISKGTKMSLNYSDHDNIPVITSSFLACGSKISSASR